MPRSFRTGFPFCNPSKTRKPIGLNLNPLAEELSPTPRPLQCTGPPGGLRSHCGGRAGASQALNPFRGGFAKRKQCGFKV